MPRTPAQDTPAQRELKVLNAVSRRLDELTADQVGRIIDWMDGLVDGDPEKVEAEIKAMKAIAGVMQPLDRDGRDSAVRWVNQKYGKQGSMDDRDHRTMAPDGPIPL
jgi:hypothetical protein